MVASGDTGVPGTEFELYRPAMTVRAGRYIYISYPCV